MKKMLIICLFFASLAFAQATGNLWPYYEFKSADSAFLILHNSSGFDTLVSVTDTTRIDTSISCGSLADGVNVLEFAVYYIGDTTKYSATDIFNNVYTGGDAAAGSLSVKYDVAFCDSIMMIHESQGSVDTTIWTSVYGIDTTIACASMDIGVHNFIVRFLYNGITDWLSGSIIFHNSSAAGGVTYASTSVDYVTCYINMAYSQVSPGGVLSKITSGKAFLTLIGEPGIHFCDSTWGFIPISYPAKADPNGRFTFYVPANTKLCPPGSYYELRFAGIPGSYFFGSSYTRFLVDTLPDPLNILDAPRVP